MPIYEYLCEGCGRITERMQKMSEPPLRTCPECGSRKVAKLVSRTAFQLKGGGWYADLYSSSRKDAKGGEAGATAGADGAGKPKAAGAPGSGAAGPATSTAGASTVSAGEKRAAADRPAPSKAAGSSKP